MPGSCLATISGTYCWTPALRSGIHSVFGYPECERYRMVLCYIVLGIHYHECVHHLHFNSGTTEKHRRVEAPEAESVSTAQITFQHDKNYLQKL